MQTNASLGPDRDGQVLEKLLEQNEGGFLSHPPACFMPLGDNPRNPCLFSHSGLSQ